MKSAKNDTRRGFTLLELLMVVAILLILLGISLPVYNGLVTLSLRTHTTNGLKNMVNATHLWAADNANKLPSPIYPGGHVGELPEYHALNVTGESGMWLNGVVYAVIALGLDNMNEGTEVMLPPDSERADQGDHLVGTIFESKVSVKKFPSERDWFKHTYAMNANLQYDEIQDLNGSSDPWLTEKDLTKYNHPKALLFVDCENVNVIFAGDARELIDTAQRRHNGKYVMAAFLDGSVRKVTENEIPDGGETTDRESSFFWRGVDLD